MHDALRASACPLDCPDACSLAVTVEAEKIRRIDGDARNPLTAAFICAKVRRFAQRVYGDNRIATPLLRVGVKGEGRFEPLSWEEALGRVAANIAQLHAVDGGAALLPYCYGGSNGFLSQDSADLRLFQRLGACRLLRTACAAPSGAALRGMFGRHPGVPLDDYGRARLIVVWGANPEATGIHLLPHLKRARQAGAKLIVVDPRRTRLAASADLHLALRPGTDLPVALALVNWIFQNDHADLAFLAAHARGVAALRSRAAAWSLEAAAQEADLPLEDLRRFAELYVAGSPALIRCGWGMERNRNGGSAVAAVLSLPVVAGKLGVAGGGFTMSNSGAWDFEPEIVAGGGKAPVASEDTRRVVNMNRLGHALLQLRDPPIKTLVIYNANPAATAPDQVRVRRGLRREDLFTVVIEQVMTDTARYADVVLPATTFLEHHELSRGYGAMVLQASAPVIAPVGEARPNFAIFTELARRLGLLRPGDPETAEAFGERLLAHHPAGAALRAQLDARGIARPPGNEAAATLARFSGLADAKIDLFPAHLDEAAPAGLYGYRLAPILAAAPLALISPASAERITSTLGELEGAPAVVHLAPGDAAARGIASGDGVRVFNDQGECRCLAQVDGALRAGVALLPKGLWSHHTLDGNTANALIADELTDLGGGACFNDARVEIEAL